MTLQRIRFGIGVEIERFESPCLQSLLITFHRRAMQPNLLLVKLHRVTVVTKEETVFDQHDPGRIEFQPRMINKQLMWKNEEIQSISIQKFRANETAY